MPRSEEKTVREAQTGVVGGVGVVVLSVVGVASRPLALGTVALPRPVVVVSDPGSHVRDTESRLSRGRGRLGEMYLLLLRHHFRPLRVLKSEVQLRLHLRDGPGLHRRNHLPHQREESLSPHRPSRTQLLSS